MRKKDFSTKKRIMGDDMPALSDTRRIVRLIMVMDEVRLIAHAYKHNTLHKIRKGLTDEEFFICGGAAVEGETYSFYRQLVLAKRDIDAYALRGVFPVAECIKKAYKLYQFYPSDDEDLEAIESAKLVAKEHVRLKRVAFVLKRFRRCVRNHKNALDSCEARDSFLNVQLSKEDYVTCGGHRTVSAKSTFSFYRQVVLACRDLRFIMKKGRHCKSDLKGKRVADIKCISSEDEEEDVDAIDCSKTGTTRSLHDSGVVDEDAAGEFVNEEEDEEGKEQECGGAEMSELEDLFE